MPRPYNSATTMFVYLKGHHVLEYYFGVANARTAANDGARGVLPHGNAGKMRDRRSRERSRT
jgi:hypothetical protein